MIKIGEFSKIAKTTIKTLRYYDDIGLFKPYFVDENGYRYYQLYQLKDLLKIINLRALDLPIDKILDILNGKDENVILSDHIKYLESEKKKKSMQIASLKKILKGERRNMEFEIKEIEKKKVYYRTGIIPTMDNLFDFVLESGSRCAILNPNLKCKDYCYVTYGAKEYKEKDIEVTYAEEVEEIGIEGNEVYFKEEPKIKALCVKVKGSYSNLASGYEFALSSIKELGYEIVGDIREVYIHGCWDKDSETDYLTEIQVPIK